jgi:hypothetical protein
MKGPVQTTTRQGPLIADDPVARRVAAALKGNGRSANVIRRGYEQGTRTFTWTVADPDGDRLRYALEIRKEGSDDWFPLATGLEDDFYSWDARAMPDGHYRVRLTADDSSDNPDGAHLSDHRVSEAFMIDNSRPSVRNMKVRRSGEECVVSFVAEDPGGSVVSAEVAIDGGSWQTLRPLDGVADSDQETFELDCPVGTPRKASPQAMMVRVTDAAGNLGGEMWLIQDR